MSVTWDSEERRARTAAKKPPVLQRSSLNLSLHPLKAQMCFSHGQSVSCSPTLLKLGAEVMSFPPSCCPSMFCSRSVLLGSIKHQVFMAAGGAGLGQQPAGLQRCWPWHDLAKAGVKKSKPRPADLPSPTPHVLPRWTQACGTSSRVAKLKTGKEAPLSNARGSGDIFGAMSAFVTARGAVSEEAWSSLFHAERSRLRAGSRPP